MANLYEAYNINLRQVVGTYTAEEVALMQNNPAYKSLQFNAIETQEKEVEIVKTVEAPVGVEQKEMPQRTKVLKADKEVK